MLKVVRIPQAGSKLSFEPKTPALKNPQSAPVSGTQTPAGPRAAEAQTPSPGPGLRSRPNGNRRNEEMLSEGVGKFAENIFFFLS